MNEREKETETEKSIEQNQYGALSLEYQRNKIKTFSRRSQLRAKILMTTRLNGLTASDLGLFIDLISITSISFNDNRLIRYFM